ncbi:hypothetical protein TSA1_34355 [Bradyrhizobium nitroreducens]|uniref:Uncharacterized protein n=1 Tax=Bradyrhizobium nitroreducens TaxID=709803 RepID=A0A2M6UKX4_9BRAD|nr:hypothetical protein TSA1_34355 [Bradyrhizobium nitroreducens]
MTVGGCRMRSASMVRDARFGGLLTMRIQYLAAKPDLILRARRRRESRRMGRRRAARHASLHMR